MFKGICTMKLAVAEAFGPSTIFLETEPTSFWPNTLIVASWALSGSFWSELLPQKDLESGLINRTAGTVRLSR